MPSTHRPVSALDDSNNVVVDRSDLKSKGFAEKTWAGPIAGYGTVNGISFENGNGQIELLFVGSPQGASLGDICTKSSENIIRPMIAQPSRASADAMPWVPDAATLIAKHWTLQPLKDAPFDGIAIVSTTSGSTTLVAFYRGSGQPANVCAT